jgi:hypothetical protein
MAWMIAQAYDIEMNQSFYGEFGQPERITYMTSSEIGGDLIRELRETSMMQRDYTMHSFVVHKRTLSIIDHRNNQLNSRINKKAD